MKNFQQALESGAVVIRRIFKSKGNQEGNRTIQFQQLKNGRLSQTGNSLTSILIGNGNSGKTKPTFLHTITKDNLAKLGLPSEYEGVSADGTPNPVSYLAENLFGRPVELRILECHEENSMNVSDTGVLTPNTNRKIAQMINPQTSAKVTANGSPVYRHVFLVVEGSNVGGTTTDTFLTLDNPATVQSTMVRELETASSQAGK